MIVDPRIYLTIIAPAAALYLAICFMGMATASNDRAQVILNRAVLVDSVILVLTSMAAFLDWLWS